VGHRAGLGAWRTENLVCILTSFTDLCVMTRALSEVVVTLKESKLTDYIGQCPQET
jgi:hypothetical protein